MVLLENPDDQHPSFRPSYSHSDSMASMCGSPEPGEFAVPSSMSDSSENGGKNRDLIPARKQREFTPDTRKDDTYWDRRRRNNEAAKRSREKRRMNDMVLETRVMELTTENQWLKAELTAIREKCGIPKDASPMVNPSSISQQPAPMASFSPPTNKDSYNHAMPAQLRQTAPSLPTQHGVPNMRHMFPNMAGGFLPPVHPSLIGGYQGRVLIPNPHMYLQGNMIPPQYNRHMSCQSVSPIPRSSSSGSRESPCGSTEDPRENGGAISPTVAAVSSLLKLANNFKGYPHMPRDDDSDAVFVGKHDDVNEFKNHLPLKLRHKTRIEYEPSPSPPMTKPVLSSSGSSSSRDEDDFEGSAGLSGEDSAVDVSECESRKRKAPHGGASLQTENVQLRGELQRLASEVANLKVMMKNPDSPAPPAKKQRKSRSRR